MTIEELLSNELIQKYFTNIFQAWVPNIPFPEKEFMAFRILQAMCEKVNEGEQYLAISEYGKVSGPYKFTSSDNWKFHCQWLRLPDQFQEKKKSDVYGIGFWAHGEKHDIEIDLECLKKALKDFE